MRWVKKDRKIASLRLFKNAVAGRINNMKPRQIRALQGFWSEEYEPYLKVCPVQIECAIKTLSPNRREEVSM
jgi:hypothetical protein